MPVEIREHRLRAGAHETFYLAAGPEDGPLVIFVHGWPELSLSWRHQLPALAALGYHAVAPDLRGYGRSSVYDRHQDYAQALVVADMIAFLDALGREQAVWVGHDWGSPTVWNIASHHGRRCHGVANLCVPYFSIERGLDAVIERVDRRVYSEDDYPAGQWEYMRFYEENFAAAIAPMDADPYLMVKALFRKGNPAGAGAPSLTAMVRQAGGWFGGAATAPDLPRDGDVVSEDDLRTYAQALARNGFFGPGSYYMNHARNAAYAAQADNDGVLELPVLFLAARYDYTCESVVSSLADPMRLYCRSFHEQIIDSGHWMAQERPLEVNDALADWLANQVPTARP